MRIEKFETYGFMKMIGDPTQKDFERFFKVMDLVNQKEIEMERLLPVVYERQIGRSTFYYIEIYYVISPSGMERRRFHFYKASYYAKNPSIKNYTAYYEGENYSILLRAVNRQCFYLKERV